MSESKELTSRLPAPELDRYARLGQWLAALESGNDEAKARGAANALRFYYADELQLPPTAVAEITVIHGRLYIGAQLLRALAERAGYRVLRSESTDTTCTAQLVDRDSGELLGEATFTIEDASRAGLVRDRSPWKTHPARMLWARASKNVISDFAPAVSLGIHTDDEMEEIEGVVVAEEDVEWPDEPTEGEIYQAEQDELAARAEGE